MTKILILVMSLILFAGCEPEPTQIEDIDLEKLEGMQSECASNATEAAWDSFSWTDFTSLDGAAEAFETIKEATHTGLQDCIADIYLMGIEDGRVLEREVY